MTTGGRLRPCETKWYFVENEDNKIVIHNSANRPLKKDSKELGYVLNISSSKSDKKDERLKVREKTFESNDCQPKVL